MKSFKDILKQLPNVDHIKEIKNFPNLEYIDFIFIMKRFLSAFESLKSDKYIKSRHHCCAFVECLLFRFSEMHKNNRMVATFVGQLYLSDFNDSKTI